MTILNRLRARLGPRRIPAAPAPPRLDLREIEKACARLFSTEDGARVLGYLNGITFMRAAGPDTADQALRYLEGQRALLATILRLAERGRG